MLPAGMENQVEVSAINWIQSSDAPGKAPDFRMSKLILSTKGSGLDIACSRGEVTSRARLISEIKPFLLCVAPGWSAIIVGTRSMANLFLSQPLAD
jgi:hypothetical protein